MSSSRDTRIAKQSESSPESRRPRSSVSGGRDLSCSAATVRISSRTIDLVDMLVTAPDRQRNITKTDTGKSSILCVSSFRKCGDQTDGAACMMSALQTGQTEAVKHCQNRGKIV